MDAPDKPHAGNTPEQAARMVDRHFGSGFAFR